MASKCGVQTATENRPLQSWLPDLMPFQDSPCGIVGALSVKRQDGLWGIARELHLHRGEVEQKLAELDEEYDPMLPWIRR